MDHMRLSDELRQQLLESAAWGKAGINLTEESSEEQLEEGTKKGKTRKTARKAFEKEKEKPKRQDASTEPESEGEQLEEAAIHVCPLCTSQLDEAIEEDQLVEHLNVVMGLIDRLSNLNEEEEDVDAVIDTALEELLLPVEPVKEEE